MNKSLKCRQHQRRTLRASGRAKSLSPWSLLRCALHIWLLQNMNHDLTTFAMCLSYARRLQSSHAPVALEVLQQQQNMMQRQGRTQNLTQHSELLWLRRQRRRMPAATRQQSGRAPRRVHRRRPLGQLARSRLAHPGRPPQRLRRRGSTLPTWKQAGKRHGVAHPRACLHAFVQ